VANLNACRNLLLGELVTPIVRRISGQSLEIFASRENVGFIRSTHLRGPGPLLFRSIAPLFAFRAPCHVQDTRFGCIIAPVANSSASQSESVMPLQKESLP
jgi:hypothetical protein